MSHEIYELAHSPCRHNLFISVDVLLHWCFQPVVDGVFWKRELIVRAHAAAQVFYFPVWLTVSHLSTSAGEPVVQLICIFVHPLRVPSSHLFFFFLWTAHETYLSDWLVLRGLWIWRTQWLDLCWGGKQPFLRIRFSLIQSMGRRSKENTERVVLLLELLSIKSLDVHILNLYFPVQWAVHTQTSSQGSLLILRLDSPPFSLPLSVAAEYDVHSLLSSWFWLASNQWWAPVSCCPCYCCPDYTRMDCWVSSLVTCSHPICYSSYFHSKLIQFLLFYYIDQSAINFGLNESSPKVTVQCLFGYTPHKSLSGSSEQLLWQRDHSRTFHYFRLLLLCKL